MLAVARTLTEHVEYAATAASSGPCRAARSRNSGDSDRPSRATEVMRPLPDNEPDVDLRWVICVSPKR